MNKFGLLGIVLASISLAIWIINMMLPWSAADGGFVTVNILIHFAQKLLLVLAIVAHGLGFISHSNQSSQLYNQPPFQN
jgi:hypothetical protein